MFKFSIDLYNKKFNRRTSSYTKICNGSPCEYIDRCNLAVFCSEDYKNKTLKYIPGMSSCGGTFSAKSMCMRDDFPKGGIDLEFVKKIHELGMSKFPGITPTLEEMVAELKEIGMFKE